jgi:hypothetical protein
VKRLIIASLMLAFAAPAYAQDDNRLGPDWQDLEHFETMQRFKDQTAEQERALRSDDLNSLRGQFGTDQTEHDGEADDQ